MVQELALSKDSLSHNLLASCCTAFNWVTHLYICSLVGSYYHIIAFVMIMCIYWYRSSVRIFILLANYIMNVHIFCHYYNSLSTLSILMLFISSIMLIIIAFIKLYTARRVFMETCFTTTIVFYIMLNFYIYCYYMLKYYSIDCYYSLDKLFLSLSLWMICCWNVRINDQSNYNNRLTITAIMGIISQAIFLLRCILSSCLICLLNKSFLSTTALYAHTDSSHSLSSTTKTIFHWLFWLFYAFILAPFSLFSCPSTSAMSWS